MTTYRAAGVDLRKADRAMGRIARLARRTYGPEVISDPRGFAGLFELDGNRLFRKDIKRPVLVGCTDGAGTKVKIAAAVKRHREIGIDLVAMSVNDLIATGATPLFFLDYVAMGKLRHPVLEKIVEGVVEGCRRSDCALLGGETAEMPGLYSAGEYDLAGFAVGIVERNRILDGTQARAGDVAIALPSSGLHSNGFSLVRRALGARRIRSMARELLTPTEIYVQPILAVLRRYPVKRVIRGIAHITGGGIAGNVSRVIPRTCDVEIHRDSWTPAPVFEKVRRAGRIPHAEMFRVFNMGIGMIVIVHPHHAAAVLRTLKRSGVRAWRAGSVVRGTGQVRILPE